MFGGHRISVQSHPGDKYSYRCSCGATGYLTGSYTRAQQMGQQHKTNAKR